MLTYEQLETQLEDALAQRSTEARSIRTVDRQVKELQSQLDRRDKQYASISEDLSKARDKISNLLGTIDELQSSDSANQLAAKRAERELREERERSLRLERELEGWKGLRLERGSARGGNGLNAPAVGLGSEAGSVRGRGIREGSAVPGADSGEILPPRQLRRVSATKGFL